MFPHTMLLECLFCMVERERLSRSAGGSCRRAGRSQMAEGIGFKRGVQLHFGDVLHPRGHNSFEGVANALLLRLLPMPS